MDAFRRNISSFSMHDDAQMRRALPTSRTLPQSAIRLHGNAAISLEATFNAVMRASGDEALLASTTFDKYATHHDYNILIMPPY